MLKFMTQDLSADIFDVALLARELPSKARASPYVAPFCPLLTQGWNLLRSRNVKLPQVLDDAQDDLEAALWTTFKPNRANLILTAMKQGILR